jgi:hypothetical protein
MTRINADFSDLELTFIKYVHFLKNQVNSEAEKSALIRVIRLIRVAIIPTRATPLLRIFCLFLGAHSLTFLTSHF